MDFEAIAKRAAINGLPDSEMWKVEVADGMLRMLDGLDGMEQFEILLNCVLVYLRAMKEAGAGSQLESFVVSLAAFDTNAKMW